MHSTIALRPYQHECLDAIVQALDRDVRRQLAVLPTGTGKTIIFANLIGQRPGRAIVLAHRDELIQQAAATPKQLATLHKMRITAPANIKVGQASDLIAQRITARCI